MQSPQSRAFRRATEELAMESQCCTDIAIKAGHVDIPLIPVLHEDVSVTLDREEFPRPQTTLEGLDGLMRQAFLDLEFDHIHHAGNSSGVVDGSGALLMASASALKERLENPRTDCGDGQCWRQS